MQSYILTYSRFRKKEHFDTVGAHSRQRWLVGEGGGDGWEGGGDGGGGGGGNGGVVGESGGGGWWGGGGVGLDFCVRGIPPLNAKDEDRQTLDC